MSVVSPLINDWIKNKLKWTYTFQPVLGPFTLRPGQKRQIPLEDFIFRAPEGTLVFMSVMFDDPQGGMSMESEPNLDFGVVNTIINNLASGHTVPSVMTHARVPPDTPAGLFSLASLHEWPWLEWCKLFIINGSATQAIRCIGFGYTMAYLTEPRKTTLLDIERIKLYQELYPNLKTEIQEGLESTAKKQVNEVI